MNSTKSRLQVLGMINNYQEDAGEVDDRDSGSLTILAKLKEGDQVCKSTCVLC